MCGRGRCSAARLGSKARTLTLRAAQYCHRRDQSSSQHHSCSNDVLCHCVLFSLCVRIWPTPGCRSLLTISDSRLRLRLRFKSDEVGSSGPPARCGCRDWRAVAHHHLLLSSLHPSISTQAIAFIHSHLRLYCHCGEVSWCPRSTSEKTRSGPVCCLAHVHSS